MEIVAVTYTYDERTELRMTHRPKHREFLAALHEAGTVLLSGPWADDGPAGALILLAAPSAAAALAILDDDPLYVAGVISKREAREWEQVFGPF